MLRLPFASALTNILWSCTYLFDSLVTQTKLINDYSTISLKLFMYFVVYTKETNDEHE